MGKNSTEAMNLKSCENLLIVKSRTTTIQEAVLLTSFAFACDLNMHII